MAVTEVNLTGQGWSDEKDGTRTYTRTYDVHTDDPDDTMVEVRAALPLNWDADPVDGAAIVVTRNAEQDKERRMLWRGSVEWKWSPEDAEDDEEPDPLDRSPKIRWTSRLERNTVEKSRDGKACLNSAGDYFDPPLEADFARWTANIQFNATSIPSDIRTYAGAVNSGAIEIDGEPVAAERARIIGLDIGEVQVENEVAFRSITLAVEVRDDDDEDYELHPLDQGYRVIDGTERKDILIEDTDGNLNRPTSPVLLNGSGTQLADPDPDNAVFLDIQNPAIRLKDLTIFPGIDSP